MREVAGESSSLSGYHSDASPGCQASGAPSDAGRLPVSPPWSCGEGVRCFLPHRPLPLHRSSSAPVVTCSGATTYGVTGTVAISCAATAALSGPASNTCVNLSEPAASVGPGTHTRYASATDLVANQNSATVTYTVTVPRTDLCTLTIQYSEKSGISNALCQQLVNAGINDYINHVQAQSGKALTPDEAATLIRLAGYVGDPRALERDQNGMTTRDVGRGSLPGHHRVLVSLTGSSLYTKSGIVQGILPLSEVTDQALHV